MQTNNRAGKKPKMEAEVSKAYNTIASEFHDVRAAKGTFFNEFLDMPNTLKVLGSVKGKKILDIGCGPGLYANILYSGGAEVHGIDISEKEIEIAKQHYKGIDFRVASAAALPYRDEYFDVVLIALALTHFEDIDVALDEASRVLKPHGHLVISEGNPVVDVTKRIKGKPKTYRRFKNYFDEGLKYVKWKKKGVYSISMPVRHVTYETFFRMFREHGFLLYDYIDSRPSPKGKNINATEYRFTSRVPYFLVFDLVKLTPGEIKKLFGS